MWASIQTLKEHGSIRLTKCLMIWSEITILIQTKFNSIILKHQESVQ